MNYKYLIGIDEVGRGPIAGPVAVGVFVFLQPCLLFKNVKESKQLNQKKREEWFSIIKKAQKQKMINFAVTFQSQKVIDEHGISFAIKKAILISLKKFNFNPNDCLILLDGGLKAPAEYLNQKTIIKGDEKEEVIALASICAKVLRDRKMARFSKSYPGYGFEIHKGYGTRGHYEAIKLKGLTDLHRKGWCKAAK